MYSQTRQQRVNEDSREREREASATISHGIKSRSVGEEGADLHKRQLKMFPFYAVLLYRYYYFYSTTIELFLWFQKSHLAPLVVV